MRHPAGRHPFFALASTTLLLSGAAGAADQVPLKNWTVSPAIPGSSLSALGTLGTLGDSGQPAIFVPFSPCRMVDTRGGGAWTGAYGPPALPASSARSFPMTSPSGPCPGIPTGAAAISLNITVVNTAGPGFIMIYPEGGSVPTVSTLNYNAGQVLANAATVPMSTSGGITVVAGVSGTDLILDVNGYFIGGGTGLNDGEQLFVSGSYGSGGIIRAVNHAAYGFGGLFETYGTTDDSKGAVGVAYGATGVTFGLDGRTDSATAGASGVIGRAGSATGTVYGVQGTAVSTTNGAAGVYGHATGQTGQTYGVYGESDSVTYGSAGVFALAGTPSYPNGVWTGISAVLANSTSGWGVLGKATSGRGVQGARVDATTGNSAGSTGVLGYAGSYGVYSFNDLGVVGTKSFVEPHPTDPARQIVFVAMEGPEAGTYFRGRGRFIGKSAVIAVPEEFRLVTEEEGLTVQITPIGRIAGFAVVSMGLDRIVAESTQDVEFSYLVQGVRKNYKGHEPIQKNTLFVPMGFDARMESYPAHIQQRLVDLGIYNADGTVNLATSERMGWAQTWREEAAAAKAAAAARAAARAAEDRSSGPGGAPRR